MELFLNTDLSAALDKLSDKQVKAVNGSKERVMAGPVAEALRSFCRQDAEFAQAVAQGGSFAECMAAVAKGVGQSISDVDAYKKAVGFYLPGADMLRLLRLRQGSNGSRRQRIMSMSVDFENMRLLRLPNGAGGKLKGEF